MEINIGIIIGAFGLVTSIIAILISRKYFKKSLIKSLTPYIQFSSSPLKRIDPLVRKQLLVKYRDQEIKELFEIQFLIANTGDKSIKDIIKPLTIEIPQNSKILDVTLLYVNPEKRNIQIDIKNDSKIELVFPLLNGGEFFIVKLLLDNELSYNDFDFLIVSDELPPVLKKQFLGHDSIGSINKKKGSNFEWAMLSIGIICALSGTALIILLYANFAGISSHIWLEIVCCIPTLIISILGILLIIVSLVPSKKPRFIVPDDEQLLKHNYFFGFPDVKRMIGENEQR